MTSNVSFREIKSRNLKELDQTVKSKRLNVVQSVVMIDISDAERKFTFGETVLLRVFILRIVWRRHVFSLKSKERITDERQS